MAAIPATARGSHAGESGAALGDTEGCPLAGVVVEGLYR